MRQVIDVANDGIELHVPRQIDRGMNSEIVVRIVGLVGSVREISAARASVQIHRQGGEAPINAPPWRRLPLRRDSSAVGVALESIPEHDRNERSRSRLFAPEMVVVVVEAG